LENIKNPDFLENLSYILLLISFYFCIFGSPFLFFMIFSLVVFIIYFIRSGRYKDVSFSLHDYFLAAFLVSIIFSALFSKNTAYAWEGFGVFCFYVIIYMYFKLIPLDREKYKGIVIAISAALIVCCGFALIHYFIIRQDIELSFFGKHLYTLEPATTFENHPLNSIFQWPWRGGNLVFIIMIFSLSFFITKYRKLNKVENSILAAAVIISMLTLYLTYTRAAVVSLVIVLVLSFILTRKFIILYLIIAVAVFFLLFKGDKIMQTFQDPLNSPNVPSRLFQYKEGLEIYSNNNNIVFGIGLLNFQVEFNNKFPGQYIYDQNSFIHNNYIAILVETGVAGFAGFFGFLILLFISVIRKKSCSMNPAVLNAVTFLSAFFVSSLYDAVLYSVPIGIFFWIIAGLSQNRDLEESYEK